MKEKISVKKNVTDLVLDGKHYERMFYDIQRNILQAVCLLIHEGNLPSEYSPKFTRFIRTNFGPYIVDVQRFYVNTHEDDDENFKYDEDISFSDTHERVAMFVRNSKLPNDIPNKMMYCTEWSLTEPWLSKYADQISFDYDDEYRPENAFETKYIYLLADILDELHLHCKANDIEEYPYCYANGYDFINLKFALFEYARLYGRYLKIVEAIGDINFELEYDTREDLEDNLGHVIESKENEFIFKPNTTIKPLDEDDMDIPF